MNNNNTPPTRFEHLSVEIFQEIFGFLSLRDIVKAFFHLNCHINSVIRSTTTLSHTVKSDEIISTNLANLFARQITHLIAIHANVFDFKLFTNLRSLTLKYGTCTQLESIRPEYGSRLEILHIYASKSRYV